MQSPNSGKDAELHSKENKKELTQHLSRGACVLCEFVAVVVVVVVVVCVWECGSVCVCVCVCAWSSSVGSLFAHLSAASCGCTPHVLETWTRREMG